MITLEKFSAIIDEQWPLFIQSQRDSGIDEKFVSMLEKSDYFKTVHREAVKRGITIGMTLIYEGGEDE